MYVCVKEIIWGIENKTTKNIEVIPTGNMVDMGISEFHSSTIEPLDAGQFYSGNFKVSLEIGKKFDEPKYEYVLIGTFQLSQATNIPEVCELNSSVKITDMEIIRI